MKIRPVPASGNATMLEGSGTWVREPVKPKLTFALEQLKQLFWIEAVSLGFDHSRPGSFAFAVEYWRPRPECPNRQKFFLFCLISLSANDRIVVAQLLFISA
jgi:hypothetical protein